MPNYQYNRHAIQQHFDQAATRYDDAALLQKAVASHLIERLELIKLQPQTILDLGSGTGLVTKQLQTHYPKCQLIALDLSSAMLKHAQKSWPQTTWQKITHPLTKQNAQPWFINADGNHLPLADQSVEMVISNLMLQWCDDLDQIFKEVRRILKPGGLFIFTTLGPDTLKELRNAWRTLDKHPHVNEFIDMHDLGDALIRCGFGQPVMDMEMFTLTYSKPIQVLKDLKAIGATNAHQQQHKGLMGKTLFTNMLNAYAEQAKATRTDGMVAASYEVVHGLAWADEEIIKGPNRNKNGAYEITLEEFAKQTQMGTK